MGYDERQVMLTLSYIAFSGFYRTGFDYRRSAATSEWIRRWLALLPPTANAWDLVWGPASFRFPATLFDDNMMFVVRHRVDTQRYAVVVRGTNPVSLPNWVLEDFLVLGQRPWTFGEPDPERTPKLSASVRLGLGILRGMKPELGVPGAGRTLRQFLAQEVAAHSGDVHITLTGHSLAGALAPTLALYLADTRGGHRKLPAWDPDGRAQIRSVAFAGPTPGNADFAARFRQRLGNALVRITCDKDIVPLAWQIEDLPRLRTVYEPELSFPLLMRPVLSAVTTALRSHQYMHLDDQAPLAGELDRAFPDYWLQAAVQHIASYPRLLGLEGELMMGAEPLLSSLEVMQRIAGHKRVLPRLRARLTRAFT